MSDPVPPAASPRRFILDRKEDLSGVSGTGIVAQGVVFFDGSCVLKWFGEHSSTNMYISIEELEQIHGHEGRTFVVFLDP